MYICYKYDGIVIVSVYYRLLYCVYLCIIVVVFRNPK